MKENRKSPTKITPELIERMKELVESGMQNKDICKELGIGSTTLTRYKKKSQTINCYMLQRLI